MGAFQGHRPDKSLERMTQSRHVRSLCVMQETTIDAFHVSLQSNDLAHIQYNPFESIDCNRRPCT